MDCAAAVPLCAIEESENKKALAVAAQFSDLRAPPPFQLTFRSALLAAFAIAASGHCNLIVRSI